MRRWRAFLAGLTSIFLVNISRSASAIDACWCKADPSLYEPGRERIFFEHVLYSKNLRQLPYITDPNCPNIVIKGISIDHSALTPCDTRAHICPVPELTQGAHLIEIRCEGTFSGTQYFLGGSEIINIDRTAPKVDLLEAPTEGQSISGGIINLSGTVADLNGVGPEAVFVDLEFSDPWTPRHLSRQRLTIIPDGGKNEKWMGMSWVGWRTANDFSSLGPSRVVARIWASDILGNQDGLGNSLKPPIVRKFMINIPPTRVVVTTPTTGAVMDTVESISGTAEDPWGLKEVAVSIREWRTNRYWNGTSFDSTAPVVAAHISASGKSAFWSYSGLRSEVLRQDEKYIVSVFAKDIHGVESPIADASFVYRDKNLAIIMDKKQGEQEVLRAIESVSRKFPVADSTIETLIHVTYDREERIRYAAANALAQIGRPALPMLLQRLLTGDGSQVPYLAHALGNMPPDCQREALPKLAEYLHDPEMHPRETGAFVLGHLRHMITETQPLLVTALGDLHPRVRNAAASSLAAQDSKRPAVDAIPGLIAMLTGYDESGRYWSGWALERIGPPARSALEPLLSSPSPQTVTDAAIVMAHISSGAAAGFSRAIASALKDKNEAVRSGAFEALKLIGPAARETAPEVIAASRDEKNSLVSSMAMQALLAIDPDSMETKSAIHHALSDPARIPTTAWALGQQRSSLVWAVPDLIDAMRQSAHCSQNGYPGSNSPAETLVKIGPAAVPSLIAVLKENDPCLQMLAVEAVGKIGIPAHAAASELTRLADSDDHEMRRQAMESLEMVAPDWDPKHAMTATASTNLIVTSEFEPASLQNVIVPYLIHELNSKDEERASSALVDLAYLGPAADAALPKLRDLIRQKDTDEKAWVDEAISLIEGVKPKYVKSASNHGNREAEFAHLPLIDRSSTAHEPDLPLTRDVVLSFLPPKAPSHVGGAAELEFKIETNSSMNYWARHGSALRILSVQRIDAQGLSHPVNVPVTTLYRGSYLLFGAGGSGFVNIDSAHSSLEHEALNYHFILDRPGRYRFVADAVVATEISTSSAHANHAQSPIFRTNAVTADIELLPRDEAASGRRFVRLNSELKRLKDWESIVDESQLAWIIDYDMILSILHVIEVAGGSSTAGTAIHGLAYLCDKKRVHSEVLRDIEANKRPHDESEAKALAEVLAAAETIPCRPAKSASDEDYVRWDVAYKRWEDQLLSKLHSR